jgi:hypothetical protein
MMVFQSYFLITNTKIMISNSKVCRVKADKVTINTPNKFELLISLNNGKKTKLLISN